MANRVLINNGAGLTISGSSGNRVVGNEIRGNLLDGISVGERAAHHDRRVERRQRDRMNGLNGIGVSGNSRGTVIVANSIIDSG